MNLKDKLDKLYDQQLNEIGDLSDKSISIITVGNDPASQVYVNNKKKLLEKTNCVIRHIVLPEDIKQDELDNIVKGFRADTGILIQLPLPNHLIAPVIPDDQDVDGFNPNAKVLPCTVQACLDIMDEVYGDISGSKIAILGRSNIVGLPLVMECIKRSATVTSFNSKSEKVDDWSKFDIVVSATGNRFINEKELDGVKLVIDVGIHRINGKIFGDIIFDKDEDRVSSSHITPVPFGVGRFTVLNVARNLKLL